MTGRQQRFVELYVADPNATKAYREAYGVSEEAARASGARLLANVSIREAIEARVNQRAERVGLTAEYVLGGLMDNFDRAMQAVQVLDNKGHPTGEYVYQGSVANRALELLGKHLGLFPERIIATDPATQPVDQLRARREELRRKLKLA